MENNVPKGLMGTRKFKKGHKLATRLIYNTWPLGTVGAENIHVMITLSNVGEKITYIPIYIHIYKYTYTRTYAYIYTCI